MPPQHKQLSFSRFLHRLAAAAIIFATALIFAFPILSKQRHSPRQSQCMSNLKNCALAIRMYTSDYDERLPTGMPIIDGKRGWPTPAGQCLRMYSCGWPYVAGEYIRNEADLLCDRWERVPLVRAQQPAYWPTTYPLSKCLVGAAEKEVANAANKVMLYEVLPYHHDMDVTTDDQLDKNNPKPRALVIVAFADGHTKVVNMNNAMGPLQPCRGATKWNLNAGWDPKALPNAPCTDSVNNDPLGRSGLKGANF